MVPTAEADSFSHRGSLAEQRRSREPHESAVPNVMGAVIFQNLQPHKDDTVDNLNVTDDDATASLLKAIPQPLTEHLACVI